MKTAPEKLKVPPHSIEAEQSVLGSMMIAPDALDIVTELVTASDFYSRSHQLTFRAILRLIESTAPVDLITVSEELERTDDLEDAGGFTYLGDLAYKTPSAANVKAYAKIIKSRSTLRALIGIAHTAADNAYNTEGKDPEEILAEAQNQLSNLVNNTQFNQKDYDTKAAMTRVMDQVQQHLKAGDAIIGLKTHLPDLDNLLGGLKNGNMILVAARPSMGKTTFALNMVEQEALSGGYPLVFSIEMPEEQIFYKLWASIGKIPLQHIQSPVNMTDEDWTNQTNAIARLMESNLRVIDESYQTPSTMRLHINRYIKEVGRPTVIMVDYVQLIRFPGKENRTQEISEISRALKAMAKDYDCPVIVLSQLNRSVEQRADKRPVNADLRESGQLEQDADDIIMLYRDDVYYDNTPTKGAAEILLRKARMGQIGKCLALFCGEHSAFRPYADPDRYVEFNPKAKKETGGFQL